MPPVQMTRAEYQAKYGALPSIPTTSPPPDTSTPVSMTHDEYMAKYGQPQNNGTSQDNSGYNPIADKNIPIIKRAGMFFGGLANQIGNVLFSSEKGVGETLGQSAAVNTGALDPDNQSRQKLQDLIFNAQKQINVNKANGEDTTHLETALNQAKKIAGIDVASSVAPATQKSNLQALGEVGGVGLDLLSGGTYGTATKSMEAGKLFTAADRQAAQAISDSIAKNISGLPANSSLLQTLKSIGIRSAGHSALGGSVGYASDVSQNLQAGKTGTEAITPGAGTAIGLVTPALIGGVRAGVAISKEEAPRFINSLIKPSNANFAYGKNPGRTVSELGITGNSLPDFEKNITSAKQDIGQQIGDVYKNPVNAGVTVNANEDINKLNDAMTEAAKGGKNNQTIVDQLKNVRDAILFEHGIDAEGIIGRKGKIARNLDNLTAQEAQDLIQHVADQTQFTGRPSDDKYVNSVLQDIYGGIREKINTQVSRNSPEITKLNQQYGDLVSAELATRNRDKIVQRSNLIGIKAGGTGAIAGATTATVSAILTGGVSIIPTALVTLGSAGIEKAFETTAVKTRVAKWLATATPEAIKTFASKNPQLIPVLTRMLPNYAGKLNQSNPH